MPGCIWSQFFSFPRECQDVLVWMPAQSRLSSRMSRLKCPDNGSGIWLNVVWRLPTTGAKRIPFLKLQQSKTLGEKKKRVPTESFIAKLRAICWADTRHCTIVHLQEHCNFQGGQANSHLSHHYRDREWVLPFANTAILHSHRGRIHWETTEAVHISKLSEACVVQPSNWLNCKELVYFDMWW